MQTSRFFIRCGATLWLAHGIAACSNSPNPAGSTGSAGGAPVIAVTGGSGAATAGVAATPSGSAGSAVATGGAGAGARSGATQPSAGGSGAGGEGGVSGSAGTMGTAGSAAAPAAGNGAMEGVAGAAGSDQGAAGEAGSVSDADSCTGKTPLKIGDQTFTLDSQNGVTYTYIISLPKTVDPVKKAPVIIHWHALSSDPMEARSVTSIDAKAEAAHAIVVYPISPDKSWDVGSCCTTIVSGQRRDEEVFARELVKDVVAKACVDESRIYTNGFSNGGMISQMLACKMSDVFAAAAPMGSTLTISESDCNPSRPIPILLINGTADPLVGYDAPSSAGGIAVTDDQKFWVMKNQCTGQPEMFLQKGKATCMRYTQCAGGVEVQYCYVEDMGHCVPGMKTESATNCLTKSAFGIPLQLGMPDDDIDGIGMDVDFLMRFTLPAKQ